MVFRSVTYNADEVDVDLKEPKMELKDYCEQPSGTWDVAEVPLVKMYRLEWRRHGKVPMVFVQLDLKVARKSQFYVVTFLLPCVCIAFLTIFVFYLPAAAGEKICIGISILFTIVVFLLILTDILPPSDSLPLMTKFLVFTFVCKLHCAGVILSSRCTSICTSRLSQICYCTFSFRMQYPAVTNRRKTIDGLILFQASLSQKLLLTSLP